ncbi:MAG: GNVR domain-containing protein [Rhodocyclaceae bacterium]|nr:GNVR domain-containing protein [Rhodocyclaceae bacterium]
MEELLRQALVILRATWKHRHLGMLVAWIVGAIAAGVILRIPDKYEASARIFVDTQSILKPLMSGLAVQPNVEQQVMMLSRTLISRPNVEKLVRMSDLDLNLKGKAEQDALIDQLTKELKIQSIGRDNLYIISYRSNNPATAQRVVQSLVSIFVESSLGDKRQDSDSARKFIDEQIKGYEKKLEEAETRLKEFKLRNLDMQTGEGKDSISKLAENSSLLSQARLELREAENSRDALKRQILGDSQGRAGDPDGISSVSMPELDGRIDAQKRNLDALLQKYTEEHPDVRNTRRVIKELEDQKRKDVADLRRSAANNPSLMAGSGTASMELRSSLAMADSRIASLRTRVSEYESRQARQRELLKSMPQIEAEFTQLNRDYEIHKKNYSQLVDRRESAELSGDLESAGSVADFRLIDPPRASPNPVAPNRLLLLPGGLVLAFAAGLFAAFVASQLRPVFFDGKSLRDATGLPLLGTVTLIPNETRRLKERASLRRFLLATAGLVVAYGAGIAALSFFAKQAAGA